MDLCPNGSGFPGYDNLFTLNNSHKVPNTQQLLTKSVCNVNLITCQCVNKVWFSGM